MRQGKVLVVEDDFLVSTDLEAALTDAGFTVTGVATTSAEAIAFARSNTPDVAIMDVRLAHGSDGVEAALQLYSELNLRCIFATAHHDASTRLRAQAAQ